MKAMSIPIYIKDSNGQLCLNPLLKEVFRFTLTPDNIFQPLTVLAGTSSGPVICTVGQDGPFVIEKLRHWRDNATELYCTIYDDSTRRYWSNGEVPTTLLFGQGVNGAIVGTGIAPLILPETVFLPRSSTLTIVFRNPSLAVNILIYPEFEGTRYIGQAGLVKDEMNSPARVALAKSRLSGPYFLVRDQGTYLLGAGANATIYLKVPTGQDFISYKDVGISTGDFDYRIRVTNSNAYYSNGVRHVRAGMGIAGMPEIHTPTLLEGNEQVAIDLHDLSGAPNNIDIAMIGTAIYHEER
jgi:hypothetical protein